MAFRFALQAVLRMRQSSERLELLQLGAATHRLLEAEQTLAELELAFRQARATLEVQLAEGLTAVELGFINRQLANLAKRIEQQKTRRSQLAAERTRHQEKYRKAKEDIQVVENARKQQWEEFKIASSRRYQRAMDDLFLLSRLGEADTQFLPTPSAKLSAQDAETAPSNPAG
jgi:flagellar export protein FliJ